MNKLTVEEYDALLDHLIDAHGKLRCGWDGDPYCELVAEHDRLHAAGLDPEIGPVHDHAEVVDEDAICQRCGQFKDSNIMLGDDLCSACREKTDRDPIED